MAQKLDFSSSQMREIAFAYKERARRAGVVFVDDPFDQLVACVFKVLESWELGARAPVPPVHRAWPRSGARPWSCSAWCSAT